MRWALFKRGWRHRCELQLAKWLVLWLARRPVAVRRQAWWRQASRSWREGATVGRPSPPSSPGVSGAASDFHTLCSLQLPPW
eukprot:5230679-Pyramimonas_sp.AAC.1